MSGPYAYVTNPDTSGGFINNVIRIDLSTFAVAGTLTMAGAGPYGIDAISSGTYALVASGAPGANELTEFDFSSFSITNSLSIGTAGSPREVVIDPSGTYAYVTNYASSGGGVYRVQLSTFATYGAILIAHAWGIAIDPTGTYAYVTTASTSGEVSKIDLSTFAIVGSPLAVGVDPYSISIDSAGNYAYVVNSYDTTTAASTVSKIDLSTFAIVGSPLAVGGASDSFKITIDPSGTYAYVTNQALNTISKIDLSTFTVVGSLAVGTDPQSIAIDSTATYAYVANYSGTVNKIDLSTFTTVGSALTVGGTPYEIIISYFSATTGQICMIV